MRENPVSFVLINGEAQHSLWPAFANLPAGSRVVYGAAAGAARLNHIDQGWTDIRPNGLRKELAVVRVSDA